MTRVHRRDAFADRKGEKALTPGEISEQLEETLDEFMQRQERRLQIKLSGSIRRIKQARKESDVDDFESRR